MLPTIIPCITITIPITSIFVLFIGNSGSLSISILLIYSLSFSYVIYSFSSILLFRILFSHNLRILLLLVCIYVDMGILSRMPRLMDLLKFFMYFLVSSFSCFTSIFDIVLCNVLVLSSFGVFNIQSFCLHESPQSCLIGHLACQ